jgi:hypothetical protein
LSYITQIHLKLNSFTDPNPLTQINAASRGVEGKKKEQRNYCNLKQTGCKLRSSTRFYEPEIIHVLVGLLRKSPHNFNASFLHREF